MAAGNDGFLQMIAQALRGGALGSGGTALEQQGSGYREYVQNAIATGETPMPEPQWRQMQMGAQQPPSQSLPPQVTPRAPY